MTSVRAIFLSTQEVVSKERNLTSFLPIILIGFHQHKAISTKALVNQ